MHHWSNLAHGDNNIDIDCQDKYSHIHCNNPIVNKEVRHNKSNDDKARKKLCTFLYFLAPWNPLALDFDQFLNGLLYFKAW